MALFETTFSSTSQTFDTDMNCKQMIFDAAYAKQSKVTIWPATREKLGGIIVGDHLTIDQNGVLSVNFADLFKTYNSHYEFPNVGEKNYFYVDSSNGDIYLWGVDGLYYTSVGIRNNDVIYGGNSEVNNG